MFWGQHKLMQVQAELREYALSPAAWAEENYPGHGIDSYPVVTRTSRLLESEARNLQRGPARIAELRDAEAALSKVEREVLAEVERMRPTSGRVPWPTALQDFDTFCAEEMAAFESEDREYLRDRAAEDEQAAREEAEYQSALQRQSDEDDARMRAEFLALPLEEQENRRAHINALRKAMEEGKITMNDLIDWVNAASTAR